MRETNKRIKEYQKMLPHMKERVTAVLLLLAISVAMMTSATFAWMTLSRNPEVSSIATTITTNGSLEIALSGEDGKQPGETAIGDGALDLLTRNLTWGNLINLSDPKYGLNDIVLRPASLNTKTLATKPMHAVQYGPDGRVLGYLYDFKYTNYVEDEFGIMNFVPENDIKYGVRAISTVTFDNKGADVVVIRKIEAMESSLIEAKRNFKAIYDVENSAAAVKYMSAVGGLVGVHVDYTLNDTEPDASKYMKSLYELANQFLLCVVDMGDVLVEAANLCIFLSDQANYSTKAFTFDDLVDGTLTNKELRERCNNDGITLTCLDDFRVLWKKMAGYDGVIKGVNESWSPVNEEGEFVEELTLPTHNSSFNNPASNSKSIYGAYEVVLAKYQDYQKRVMNNAINRKVPWDAWMRMAVNQMCEMQNEATAATIRYEGGKDYTPQDLQRMAGNVSDNVDVLLKFKGEGPFHATLRDGAIQDVAQLLGEAMYVPSNPSININATVSHPKLGEIEIDMYPSISTSMNETPNILDTDIEEAKNVSPGGGNKGKAQAAETYAMVIDFWVRTNVDDSLLTLEGKLVYDQVAGTAENGDREGILYSYTETDATTGEEITRYIYWHQDKYYYDYDREGKNDELTAEEVDAIRIKLKPVYEEKPSGYEGTNRVWDELNDPNNAYAQNVLASNGTSTTQGSGSCYIFYPQSPEDQRQSLNLLAAMRVAFVDSNGTLLAIAYMDTENVVEDAGRVIVPLRLRANEKPVVDGTGATIDQYIAPLYKNEAMRISTIVYLEGDHLTNSEVLAAGSITGQMNIQFGTTELKLNALDDKDVMEEYYTFDFTLDGDRDGTADLDKSYEIPKGRERVVDLYLNLGTAAHPRMVEGNFVSFINATQGASQPTFKMNYDESIGLWKATITFTGPGDFKLRSIRIDGVDYTLKDDQIISVVAPGVAISAVRWQDSGNVDATGNNKAYRTAANTKQEVLTLSLQMGQGENSNPDIRGVFLGDNGQNVTVEFKPTKNAGSYTGTATFVTGGHYEMTYVYVDGTLMRLESGQYKTIDLQLGLKVEIGYTIPQLVFTQSLTDEQKNEILSSMTSTPQACYFRFNAPLAKELGAGLEVNVWCKIYDDLDNLILEDDPVEEGFDIALFYGVLDAGLKWNETEKQYEGTLLINSNGLFKFSYVELDDGSVIDNAIASPNFTSASPHAVEYVHNNSYVETPLTVALGETNQRVLKIKLKNSLGTAVKVVLSDTAAQEPVTARDGTTIEPQYYTVSNMEGWANPAGMKLTESNQADADGVVTYTVTLPKDGYWEVVGLYLGGGAYYKNEIWTGETDDRWADMSSLVQMDKIRTYFLTEVTIAYDEKELPAVEGVTIPFMQSLTSGINKNVFYPKFAVKNQGRHLSEVLEELSVDPLYQNEFAAHFQNTSVAISYYFNYEKPSGSKWEIVSGATLPTSIAPDANGQLAFLLEGDYTPNFSLTIGGVNYEGATPAELEQSLKVRWTQPEVVVSNVTGARLDANGKPTGYDTFTVNLGADGLLASFDGLDGVKNYFERYYANVYIASTSKTSHTMPEVTLRMAAGYGAATKATISLSKDVWSATYVFQSGTLEHKQPFGTTKSSGLVADRVYAGKHTISSINMEYNGAVYSIPLKHSVVINHQKAPFYLTLQGDTTQVDMPDTIAVTAQQYDGTPYTFDFISVGKSTVTIITPNGLPFKVVLPEMKRVLHGRIEEDPNSKITYDEAYNKEDGKAENAYAYYHWTTTEGSCTTTTKHHYKQYQRYVRHLHITGKRYTYDDIYSISAWSSNPVGSEKEISSNTTYTMGAITVTPKLVKTEDVNGEIYQYCYKTTGQNDMEAMNPVSEDVTDDENQIVKSWTDFTP